MVFNKFQKNVLIFAITFLILLFSIGALELTLYNNQMLRTQKLDNILDIKSPDNFKVLDTTLKLNINESLNQLDNILNTNF